MKILDPDKIPRPIRRLGRAALRPSLRHRLAADLQHLAHVFERQSVAFRHSDDALSGLLNQHTGETCVIVGNGPSLASEDLAALAHVPSFCLNRGYLKWQASGITPSFYVAVNDLVVEQFWQDIAKLQCPLFLPWKHRKLFQGCSNAIFVEMRWHKQFFPDVRRGLWPGNTVTFAALQIAYHMGFSKAVLIGVDHRFRRPEPAHSEIVQIGPDADHFTDTYFADGVKWNAPSLEESEFAYRLAREAYVSSGREIIDATRGGALKVFRKAPLKDTF